MNEYLVVHTTSLCVLMTAWLEASRWDGHLRDELVPSGGRGGWVRGMKVNSC